jgi:hypothetical protein
VSIPQIAVQMLTRTHNNEDEKGKHPWTHGASFLALLYGVRTLLICARCVHRELTPAVPTPTFPRFVMFELYLFARRLILRGAGCAHVSYGVESLR